MDLQANPLKNFLKDRSSHRDARTHLKMEERIQDRPIKGKTKKGEKVEESFICAKYSELLNHVNPNLNRKSENISRQFQSHLTMKKWNIKAVKENAHKEKKRKKCIGTVSCHLRP